MAAGAPRMRRHAPCLAMRSVPVRGEVLSLDGICSVTKVLFYGFYDEAEPMRRVLSGPTRAG